MLKKNQKLTKIKISSQTFYSSHFVQFPSCEHVDFSRMLNYLWTRVIVWNQKFAAAN